MQAVHFGAGNIGRGFIGETLSDNGYHVDFVDVNETVVDALNARQGYEIEFAAEGKERKKITNVDAINNGKDPQAVVDAIAQADIVTTAIGPNILPYIAELIAKGIQKRQADGNTQAIDVIACENMIGGSDFLKKEVSKYLTEDNASYIETYIGFPNAAVDRIVPMQSHDDVLFVSVEPFKEWVVDVSMMKSNVKLDGVLYVDDLEPYIERKLFSVNTGHATVAYTGAYNGYTTIGEAIQDNKILAQLERVLHETGALIVNKWQFDPKEHEKYIQKIITRFENPYISDEITRVARTPIRKLGYDERFIRPIRETTARSLDNDALIEVVGMIYYFNNPEDKESVQLQQLLLDKPLEAVVRQTTNLTDTKLIDKIVASVESYKK